MLSFNEARSRAASVDPLAAVTVPLEQAAGHILAEPVHAAQDVPHVATSAMDGWALAAPLQNNQAPAGWTLRAEAVHSPVQQLAPLEPGEAAEVVTGSPVPQGTVSVLRSEHGILDGRLLRAAAATPDTAPRRNIRPVGTECPAGTQVLSAGTLLTPARAAIAAVAGRDRLAVVPRPRVHLVLTGEEVITSGIPSGGQVRDVFGLALPGMLTEIGAASVASTRLGDDHEALARELAQLLEAGATELIITSGGTSHSRADSLRPALRRLGAELITDSVDMRPGHPTVVARLQGSAGTVHLLGLPGNPLAGFAALAAVGTPLIGALRGVPETERTRTLSLTAGARIHGADHGVRLLPVRIRPEGAVPLEHSSSHMMRGLADADALAIVTRGGADPREVLEGLDVPGQRRGGH
ncbi:molybdopterin molybdotransferase MoeA [Nesterenkonia halotolerans]|uniref:Molybdopterin molybdenumtransferase n=1 Tax=Nesterenkonia halotolerans TaxID=225325 RepID=A0ABR9J8I8_9MICC|nr:molybdopterin molybdotransferase MoeA [Nesterenkonia halotolerans]MBE1515312.1 molybdopterin molybdotransferase [Nesterenkonia halotolerans]